MQGTERISPHAAHAGKGADEFRNIRRGFSPAHEECAAPDREAFPHEERGLTGIPDRNIKNYPGSLADFQKDLVEETGSAGAVSAPRTHLNAVAARLADQKGPVGRE